MTIKKANIRAIITAIVILLVGTNYVHAQEGYAEGEILLQLHPGEAIQSVIDDPVLANIELQVENHFEHLAIYHLQFDSQAVKTTPVLSLVRDLPSVEAVQLNHFVKLRSTTPSDNHFSEQWSMENTGQTNGTAGADISATDAWGINTGGVTADGDQVVIGIADNGFDLSHEDLNYTQERWNAVDESDDISERVHGTAVAGVAAASGDNSVGIAGVNWNASIMPLVAYGATIKESEVVSTYEYALSQRKKYDESNGAEGAFVVVVNSSFGKDGADPDDHQLWCDSFDTLGEGGILSVAATANREDWDVDEVGDVPTACSSNYLISVTNTDHNDEINSHAAYGSETIELGAPGTNILTTNTNSDYDTYTGTSFAAPHVAGTVALMISALSSEQLTQYFSSPSDYALELRNTLLENTDAVDDLEGITVTGGRLNAYRAVLGAVRPTAPTNLAVVNAGMINEAPKLEWTASTTAGVEYEVHRCASYYRSCDMTDEIIAVTSSTSYTDFEVYITDEDDAYDRFRYKVRAVNDFKSSFSYPAFTWGDTFHQEVAPQVPTEFAIEGNHPNPVLRSSNTNT